MQSKTALVTGSRRGIGYAVLRELAKEGYSVIMSDICEREEAAAAIGKIASELDTEENNVIYIKCDISNDSDRKAIFDKINDKFGRLDVLVNNAGVAPKSRLDILETTEESFDFVVDINLKGTFFMCQYAAGMMLAAQKQEIPNYSPRIVNIASISAYTSSVNRGEYCISKAGISMVTALFADRLAEFGIPVFEVRPGIILTDMTTAVREKYEKMIADGLTPIKRFGMPEDVANCVIAAVSGRLDFATGQVLNADGGFHIRRL